MRELMGLLRPCALMLLVMTLITGALYPALVTVAAQALFPAAANGSLLVNRGGVVGSALVGQNFTDPAWFWGRPSATSPAPYHAAASGGSNLAADNPALAAAVAERVAALRAADPAGAGPVPADLATASASGLDPHLSPAAALYQVARVARARGVDPALVEALVAERVEGRQGGVLGEPRVNVLLLNLALEERFPRAEGER